MKRSILKSFCIVAGILAVPAHLLAVWPPSTSFEAKRQTVPSENESQVLPSPVHRENQQLAIKLEMDERRLEQALQDLKEDEAALQSSYIGNSLTKK